MENETETSHQADHVNPERNIKEMLTLVRRMRASQGEGLDDDAVSAIAEVTGTTTEMVRVSLTTTEDEFALEKNSRAKTFLLSLDPKLRRHVVSAWSGLMIAALVAAGRKFGDPTSLMGMLQMVVFLGATYNLAVCEDRKTAAISGALLGTVFALGVSVVLAVFAIFSPAVYGFPPFLLPMLLVGGAIYGSFLRHQFDAFAKKLGWKTQEQERLELLNQLVKIQDRLRENEREICFLSIDIVGSSRMKEGQDPLAVEFTFTEYQRFIEMLTQKNSGRVHSTAGDGVTCAFEKPETAFRAARQMQSGMIEFNSARNRLGTPIQVRAGIDYGKIVAQGSEITNVNFSKVIDRAAHLQKGGPIGGIAISLDAVERLGPEKELLDKTVVQIENESAMIWQSRARVELPTVAPLGIPSTPEFSN